jgi:ankyrin repeat protein|uniref:Ankyrin repeat domain-containing protein n=1 Tax=Calcidiscus leptoporus TaxID=127549 RepID=A0A7S0P5D8_9EUKA|mmetsp:Transcript_58920/g.135151  ORF Transcript_58920/g.135151 Transcript_58920/m.135151 type:complete len:198 (+) Transcript_58920:63-656(+)
MPRDTGLGLGLSDTYPRDAKGNPISTPDYRDADVITDTANAKDPDLVVAVRRYTEEPGLIDKALKAGADVNAQDKLGYTPLMLAIKSWNDSLIDKMLNLDGHELDYKLDVQTKRGFTALHVAAWKGNTKVAKKLLDMGATIDIKDTGGRNAWGIAHDWHHEEMLEMFKENGLTYESHGGTAVSFPPAPKWRPSEQFT